MAEIQVDQIIQTIFKKIDVRKWKPSDVLPLVLKEVDKLKSELTTIIESSKYDIEAVLEESKDLYAESKVLVEEMQICKNEIEEETMAEIVKSIEHHDNIVKELQVVNFSIDTISDVVMCGEYVKHFKDGRNENSFTKAVEAVYKLLCHIKCSKEGFQQLYLYQNTKNTAQSILDSLLEDLLAEWVRLLTWEVKPSLNKTVITITLNIDDTPVTADVLNALNICNELSEKVSEFAQFLLKDVIAAMVKNDCTVHAETEELITITINYKENFKPEYNSVIANLRFMFDFLSNKLKIDYNNGDTIIKMIGKEICVPFKDILVENCLIDTVPNNINDLQTYGRITSEIVEFQRFLIMIKFFPNEKFSILDYVENIDTIFAQKSSQYFLETSRAIMLKDLSMHMSIGVESIPKDTSGIDVCNQFGENEEAALVILNKTMPKSLFYFPRCMISRTAQELLDLIYVIMEQAVQCSDVVCKKFYDTTRLIFELYDAVVPYHHEKYLQTIPQYVALFHNNCMYLAHNLQTFGDKWMILLEGRELDYPISFVDLVHKLRELGYKHLTMHMQQQRKHILDNIRSSDLNCIVVKDVLGENAESAIKKCLRQLQLLKNVWFGIFPKNVFTRIMATLVNMFIDEIIHRVCSVEDISMEMAAQLTEMYTIVISKAPHLFLSSEDIETQVKSWVKLQELVFILGGSLKDIESRWGNGTGPLAIHFKNEELRNLIKALFQNTQFRANLLSKIK